MGWGIWDGETRRWDGIRTGMNNKKSVLFIYL